MVQHGQSGDRQRPEFSERAYGPYFVFSGIYLFDIDSHFLELMVSISFIRQLRVAALLVMLSIPLILPVSLHAFHGLFLPAYGAKQAGLGGASLAPGGSVMDLQNNPSGLALLDEGLFEAFQAFTHQRAFSMRSILKV